jgi:hypothetical protein
MSSLLMSYIPCIRLTRRTAARPSAVPIPFRAISSRSSTVSSYRFWVRSVNSPVSKSRPPIEGTA